MSHNPRRRGGSHRSGNPAARRFTRVLKERNRSPVLGQSGSCVICGCGTDSGLAFAGDLEWLAGGLVAMGVPTQEAIAMIERFPENIGQLDDGDLSATFRVCAPCVAAAQPDFPAPVLLVQGAEVPCIRQAVQTS